MYVFNIFPVKIWIEKNKPDRRYYTF